MPVQKLTIADALFERSPGQKADVFTANIVGCRNCWPEQNIASSRTSRMWRIGGGAAIGWRRGWKSAMQRSLEWRGTSGLCYAKSMPEPRWCPSGPARLSSSTRPNRWRPDQAFPADWQRC